jgi:hypothetical protein
MMHPQTQAAQPHGIRPAGSSSPSGRRSRPFLLVGVSVLAAVLVPGVVPAQQDGPTPVAPQQVPRLPEGRPPTLAELIAVLEAREARVESARLTMRTSGRQPDASTFRTTGELRLLGGEYLHASMVLEAPDDDLRAEVETLKTPAGVWMREKDPVQGEVVTFLSPKLVRDLESAQRALERGDQGILGTDPTGGNPIDAPLGSAMLESLDRAFELSVGEPRVQDGIEVYVVGGPVRSAPAELEAETPDFVEVLVRRADLAVIRLRQLRKGEKVLEVRIDELELDLPLEPASFDPMKTVLAEGRDAVVIDVMDHPPARLQIEQVFAEARQLGWTPPSERKDENGDERR